MFTSKICKDLWHYEDQLSSSAIHPHLRVTQRSFAHFKQMLLHPMSAGCQWSNPKRPLPLLLEDRAQLSTTAASWERFHGVFASPIASDRGAPFPHHALRIAKRWDALLVLGSSESPRILCHILSLTESYGEPWNPKNMFPPWKTVNNPWLGFTEMQHADDFCLALGDEPFTFQDPKSKQFTKLVDWFRKVGSTDYIM